MSKSTLETQSASGRIKQRPYQPPLQILANLLQNYGKNAKLTPLEFIEEKLASNHITEELGSMFLRLYRHKVFLGNVKDMFNDYLIASNTIKKDQRLESEEMIAILYLVIFELTPGNWVNIYVNFQKNPQTLNWVMDFLSLEDSLVKIVEEGCKIYDKDYLLENVLSRILQNEQTLQTISNASSQDTNKIKLAAKKGATKPHGPAMLNRKKKQVKLEEILEPKPFESKPVPKSTYEPNDQESLLEKARMQNQKAAYELLAEARKLNLKCAEPKSPPKPPSPVIYKPILAKPSPKFDPVEVKATTASLMRQAALLAKEKEAEIKEIEALVNGAVGDMSNSLLLEEIRQAKEEESLQDIERKHLQGLLTREEAILAKQRFHQQNQAKKQQYQEERIKLLETIDMYRREEEEKTRQLVEKVQAIETAAKDAEAKLLKERRSNAKLVEYETQILLKQAGQEREEELNKKIQLIKELKLLQQINAGTNKVEFDPSETSNLGLMCEMSIAELQERLALLKVTMKEELEERKSKILAEKKKQQTMLDQMKEFVENAKQQKCKPPEVVKPKKVAKKPVPEDIKILREKLKLAREQRANGSFTCV